LEVFLDDKELEKLYTTGQSKKLKLDTQVVEKFFASIQKIEAAMSVHDLWADKGLGFESMASSNRYSIRLNRKYRLEMLITSMDKDCTIGQFHLLKISNHYGD
jgi:toxin HigB-1